MLERSHRSPPACGCAWHAAARSPSRQRPCHRPRRSGSALRVRLSNEHDVFLFHKTTARRIYEEAKAGRPDCDDVLLWNARGEITESTIANVVLDRGGSLLTPPVSVGLLAGTMRAHLLARGEIEEAPLTKDDVLQARAVYLINSVRRWIDVQWQPVPNE